MLMVFLHCETEVQKALSSGEKKKKNRYHSLCVGVGVGVAVHTQIWAHALSQEWTKHEKAHNHMTCSMYNYDLGSNNI